MILENDPFSAHPIVKLFVDVQLVNVWGVVFRYHPMSYSLQRNCPEIIFQVEKWPSHPSLLPLLWHLHTKVCKAVENRLRTHMARASSSPTPPPPRRPWPRTRRRRRPPPRRRGGGGRPSTGNPRFYRTHTRLPRVGVQEKYRETVDLYVITWRAWCTGSRWQTPRQMGRGVPCARQSSRIAETKYF